MKEIQLTQERVVLVDDEDYEKLNKFKWFAQKSTHTFYANRNSPRINGKRYLILMHHEVIGKPPKGFETDHRSGNGLDNQKENLHHVTHRQNTQNRKNENSSSKYPGVCWNRLREKWVARIEINGISKHLGVFTNERKAFEAYKYAVKSIGEKVIEDF